MENFLIKRKSGFYHNLVPLFIAIIWYFLILMLHQMTGIYFHSITIFASILMSLTSELVLALFFTIIISLIGDYFFLPPIGSVLSDLPGVEHFLINIFVSLSMSFLFSSLRDSLIRTNQARQEAEEATASMQKLMNWVSHDIRNPLAISKLSAELILRYHDQPEKHSKLASRIVENTGRVDSMIQTLLDVSKLRSGEGLSLNYEHSDLVSIVERAIEDLSLMYGNRFVLKKADSSYGLWSADAMRRVVENLMTNAIKYGTPDCPVTISIVREGTSVIVSVHNEGNEIPLEVQAHLFDSFYQAELGKKSQIKGWGLGLSLVKGITEAHAGTVGLESTKEKGTTFFLKLPLRTSL